MGRPKKVAEWGNGYPLDHVICARETLYKLRDQFLLYRYSGIWGESTEIIDRKKALSKQKLQWVEK